MKQALFNGSTVPGSSAGTGMSMPKPTPQPSLVSAPKPSGYQGAGNMASSMLLSQAKNMGPMAPLAIAGGLDFNALGSLTKGPRAAEDFSDVSKQMPAFRPPPVPAPVTSGTAGELGQAAGQLAGSLPQTDTGVGQVAGTLPQLEGGVGRTLGDAAADIGWLKTKSVAQSAATQYGLPWAGRAARRFAPRLTGLAERYLPQVARLAPAAAEDATLLARGKGLLGLTKPSIALQTAMDTGLGAFRAGYNGSGGSLNPIKMVQGLPRGYANTTTEAMNKRPGDNDWNYHGLYAPGVSDISFDAITKPVALARGFAGHDSGVGADIGRSALDTVIQSSPLGAVIPHRPLPQSTYGETVADAGYAARTATSSLPPGSGFHYEMSPNGPSRLLHDSTGSAVPRSYQDFTRTVAPQHQAAMARDLMQRMPERFNAIFSDPRYYAMHSAGMAIPPDLQQAQDQQMAKVKAMYGL